MAGRSYDVVVIVRFAVRSKQRFLVGMDNVFLHFTCQRPRCCSVFRVRRGFGLRAMSSGRGRRAVASCGTPACGTEDSAESALLDFIANVGG